MNNRVGRFGFTVAAAAAMLLLSPFAAADQLTMRVPVPALVVVPASGTSGPGTTTPGSGTPATAPAAASVSPATLQFGNEWVGQTSPAQTVTLANAGGENLAVSAPQVTGAFVLAGSNCGTTLAGGASCSYSVAFAPSGMGAQTGNLQVQTAAGAYGVGLQGFGQLSADSVSAGALDFGSVAVGVVSAVQSVSVTNSGNVPLALSAVQVTGPFAATQNCSNTVAPGASCLVNVSFNPISAGAMAGQLSFVTNLGTQVVSLTGTGLQAQAVTTPGSLTFGNQNINSTSAAQAVTLSNPGNGPLTVGTATVGLPYSVTTTCGTSLAAGANCTYSVSFTPTVAGTANGQLSIPTSVQAQTVSLTGKGVIGTYATLNPSDKGPYALLTNGNLTVTSSNGSGVRANLGKSSGKWYFEVKLNSFAGTVASILGVAGANNVLVNGWSGPSDYMLWGSSGGYGGQLIYGTNNRVTFSSAVQVGDIVGVAVDLDNHQITFYRNGVMMGGRVAFTGVAAGTYYPFLTDPWNPPNSTSETVNFGQNPFSYSPPPGYNAGWY